MRKWLASVDRSVVCCNAPRLLLSINYRLVKVFYLTQKLRWSYRWPSVHCCSNVIKSIYGIEIVDVYYWLEQDDELHQHFQLTVDELTVENTYVVMHAKKIWKIKVNTLYLSNDGASVDWLAFALHQSMLA